VVADAFPSWDEDSTVLVFPRVGQEGPDLADVRGGEQERGEEALRGLAAYPALAGRCEGFVGVVLGEAVQALLGLAEGVAEVGALLRAVLERLTGLGAVGGVHGHGLPLVDVGHVVAGDVRRWEDPQPCVGDVAVGR
jgi:hypothetical protein